MSARAGAPAPALPLRAWELLDALKLLALATMTVDHVDAALLDRQREVMMLIGRVAFPVFIVGAAFGALRTRSPRRYLTRLLLCALVSQPFFALALDTGWRLNTVFTLFWGVAAALAWRAGHGWLSPLLVLAAMGSDYGVAGAGAVLAAALLLGGRPREQAAGAFLFAAAAPWIWLAPAQLAVGLATSAVALLLWSRAGPRTAPRGARYGFYVYYPLHLALLAAARLSG